MAADDAVRALINWHEQPETRGNLLRTADLIKTALARDDLTELQRAELERELLRVRLHRRLRRDGDISHEQARQLTAADLKVRRARDGEKES